MFAGDAEFVGSDAEMGCIFVFRSDLFDFFGLCLFCHAGMFFLFLLIADGTWFKMLTVRIGHYGPISGSFRQPI